MGEGLIRLLKEKIKAEHKTAFVLTFFIAILIHLYKFTNTLPNHDSVYNYYSDQNVLGSGRWALSFACSFSSYYDLPWVIGLLSCIFIALTVVVIVTLFKVKNPVLIGLIGALLAASPATTETFAFLYTADGYMIAMLLAALSVYFSRMDETRYSRMLLSGVCICVSCGIYQAYVSFALVLAVCYFIDILIQNAHSKKECLKWILRQIIIYIVALAAYYIIWKLCMLFIGISANDYQGISDVGKINLSVIANAFHESLRGIALYLLQWNVLEQGFSVYSVINIAFVIVAIICFVVSVIKSKIYKRRWAFALTVLCLLAIVPFAFIWHFTSPTVVYAPRMLQSLTLVFILIALLYEKWTKPITKNIVCLFLIILAFNNAIMANIFYFYMNQTYERTYAEGLEMMIEIHEFQDKYELKNIAFIGDRSGEVAYNSIDPGTGRMQKEGQIQILIGNLEQSLLYDYERAPKYLENTFGLDLEPVVGIQLTELENTEEVKALECWPAENSMTVIGDILVIKFSDIDKTE